MAEKRVSVRMVATGGGQIRSELVEIGAAGDAAFSKVKASADSASSKLKGVGTAAANANRASGAMAGGGLRQTTMQLSQVAQQASATGNWLQAFAIQLPDLALAFGPVGIAAGAVGGVLLSLVPSLLSGKNATKELEESLKAAEKSASAMTKAAAAASIPIDKLREKYGGLADEIDRADRAMAKITTATAAQDAITAARALRGTLGTGLPNMGSFLTPGGEVMAGYEKARAELLSQAVEKLGRQTGAAADEALRLANAISSFGKGGTMEATIREGEELLAALEAISPETEDQQKTLSDMAGNISSVMELAKNNVEAVTTATGNMIAGFDHGISKLEQLRNTMESWGAGSVFDKVSGWLGGLRNETLPQYGAASKGILDLIGWAEGTDRGRGYNETLDYGKWTGGPVNLVNMTLDEVLALGDRMRTPENRAIYPGGGSSALGRYQIVGSTMRRLVEQMGLTGDELFDRTMQDRMAMELVRARAKQGTKAGWDAEWQSFKTKNVSLATINAALGQNSVGVDPGIAAEQKRQNDELQRGLDLRADFLTSLQNQAEAARVDAEATGKSVYEQVRLRTETMLTQQAKAKGIDLNEKLAGSEKTYGQAIKETAASMAASAQEQAAQEGRYKAAEDAAKRAAEAMRKIQDDLKQGFHTAFQSVIDGTQSVTDAFRKMVADMLMQRAMMGFDKLIDGVFGAIFGGGDPLADALTGAGVSGVVPQNVLRQVGSAVAQQAVHVTVGVDQKSGNLTAFTDQRVAAGMSRAERAMPAKVNKINSDPLKR